LIVGLDRNFHSLGFVLSVLHNILLLVDLGHTVRAGKDVVKAKRQIILRMLVDTLACKENLYLF